MLNAVPNATEQALPDPREIHKATKIIVVAKPSFFDTLRGKHSRAFGEHIFIGFLKREPLSIDAPDKPDRPWWRRLDWLDYLAIAAVPLLAMVVIVFEQQVIDLGERLLPVRMKIDRIKLPHPAQTPLFDSSPVPPADPKAATSPEASGSTPPINPNAPSGKATGVAQGQVLSAAILQIQTLMGWMSNACSGGAHGVPPVNWTALQAHGNKALNALNEAKLALARGQTIGAVQQISSAQGELDALVNDLRKSCPGGVSGVDPNGYNEVALARGAMLKRNLDELKHSLGG
jgi:hypothetical protein